MNFFKFEPSDRILLLGEGNFSFAANLLRMNIEHGYNINSLESPVTATCLESNVDEFSSEKINNINFIKSKGVRVICGVDVNLLNQHFNKGTDVFTKVIFNFPHVGGKMKISLNKLLLRNIFSSIVDYVSHCSKVLITLCDGQGGTDADTRKRNYNDTWQVVEMAAISNFVLKFLEPFPVHLFSDYKSIGFRSSEKGFHTGNALTHVFELRYSFDTSLSNDELYSLFSPRKISTNFGMIECCKIYADLYSLDLFNKSNSLFSFLFKELVALVIENYPNVHFLPDASLPVHVPYSQGMASLLNETKVKLRSSLLDAIKCLESIKLYNLNEHLLVVKGICFKDLTESLLVSPVEGQIVLLGRNSFQCISKYFHQLSEKFTLKIEISSTEEVDYGKQIFLNSPNAGSEKVLVAETINFQCSEGDFLASVLFCDAVLIVMFRFTNWQQIWAENTVLKPGCMLPSQESLYPVTHKFDVNFFVDLSFDVQEFYLFLWNLTNIAVVSAEFLSDFYPKGGGKYLCFRIFYRSFKYPLCRSRALSFHQNIICKAIPLIFSASIN